MENMLFPSIQFLHAQIIHLYWLIQVEWKRKGENFGHTRHTLYSTYHAINGNFVDINKQWIFRILHMPNQSF